MIHIMSVMFTMVSSDTYYMSVMFTIVLGDKYVCTQLFIFNVTWKTWAKQHHTSFDSFTVMLVRGLWESLTDRTSSRADNTHVQANAPEKKSEKNSL